MILDLKQMFLNQAKAAEIGQDFYYSFLCIFRFLATRDNQLPRPKEKNYNFWLFQPVDQSRELFRFIFNLIKVEPHRNLV